MEVSISRIKYEALVMDIGGVAANVQANCRNAPPRNQALVRRFRALPWEAAPVLGSGPVPCAVSAGYLPGVTCLSPISMATGCAERLLHIQQ